MKYMNEYERHKDDWIRDDDGQVGHENMKIQSPLLQWTKYFLIILSQPVFEAGSFIDSVESR